MTTGHVGSTNNEQKLANQVTTSKNGTSQSGGNRPTPNSRPIDEVLNETEIGSFYTKHKTMVLGTLVTAILALVGFGVYWQVSHKKSIEMAKAAFMFRTNSLGPAKEGKITPEQLLDAARKFQSETNGNTVTYLPLIEVADLLSSKDKSKEAVELLEGLKIKLDRNAFFVKYFALTRLAVNYENLGNNDKALAALEEIQSLPIKIFEVKNYLDLGRLYLKTGAIDKAKTNLQYVIDQGNDQDLSQIARQYLMQIK